MAEKTFYQRIEGWFESMVGAAIRVYGHPFTFFAALLLVIFFLFQGAERYTNFRDLIRDIILCISFLSFFIIQRAVNKSTTATHLKINELIATHDKASNELLKIDEKTGTELEELNNELKTKVAQKTGNIAPENKKSST